MVYSKMSARSWVLTDDALALQAESDIQTAVHIHLAVLNFLTKGNEFIMQPSPPTDIKFELQSAQQALSSRFFQLTPEKTFHQTRPTQSKRQGFLTWILDLQTKFTLITSCPLYFQIYTLLADHNAQIVF